MGDDRGRSDEQRVVALRYDRGGHADPPSAPRVVARGAGWVADRILALAREHGIPVRQDRDLVAMLAACEIGDEISTEMYTAVAEVLAWLYRCNQELGPPPR